MGGGGLDLQWHSIILKFPHKNKMTESNKERDSLPAKPKTNYNFEKGNPPPPHAPRKVRTKERGKKRRKREREKKSKKTEEEKTNEKKKKNGERTFTDERTQRDRERERAKEVSLKKWRQKKIK